MWCPFSRILEGDTSFNRFANNIPNGSDCIEGQCAAWRQGAAEGAVGYCGLAGPLPVEEAHDEGSEETT
jgi:hypothetical protein